MHKELIEFTETLVKGLVKEPDMVSIQEFSSDDETIMLEIIVHESDMGAIIGRGGKMASAIIGGVISSKVVDADYITASEISVEAAEEKSKKKH